MQSRARGGDDLRNMMVKGDQLRLERIPSPTPSPPPSPLLRAIRVCADFESPPKMWVCAGDASGEAGSEGDASDAESGEEGASAEEGSLKRADSARKAKGRKGSCFVQHQAGHSSGSDESATEDASDADSDGNLMGFTVPDDEASESNHETDEELEQPPARRRLQRNRACDAATAAAEARLGRKLGGMKVMRLEAQRAQEVVSGEKTLELTGKRCHVGGLILIGETANGATAPSCAIGAVTLGPTALTRVSAGSSSSRSRRSGHTT